MLKPKGNEIILLDCTPGVSNSYNLLMRYDL